MHFVQQGKSCIDLNDDIKILFKYTTILDLIIFVFCILIGIRENKNLFIAIRIISKPFDGGIVIKRFSEREKESERRT